MDSYRSFPGMSRRQARAYLAQFLGEMDASHDRLVGTSEASGGPGRGELDFTRESLGPLWEWARPRYAWRADYVPVPLGQPNPWRPSGLEPASALPSWFHHPSGIGMERFDAESLWLMDGVARYAARTLTQRLPHLNWGRGTRFPPGYIHANQPVLKGFDVDLCPYSSEAGRAVSVLVPELNEPPTLVEHHDAWIRRSKR